MILENLKNIQTSDVIEILFISSAIYYFLLWLRKDTQKNLVLPFYGYCALFFTSYYSGLTLISTALLFFAPISLILFIVLHQETLQRNFVMLKKVKPKNEETVNWVQELIQSCLFALNKNKEVVFLVERDDNLEKLIKTQFQFFADYKKDLFDIILEKQICSNEYMIWINKSGKLVAINAQWNFSQDDQWIDQDAKNISIWKQDAIWITSNTDAIIFKVTPITRSFDIVIQGKIAQNINPEQLFKILESNLDKKSIKTPSAKYAESYNPKANQEKTPDLF